jgi:hypothetical protein
MNRMKIEWWIFYIYSLVIGWALLIVMGPLDPILFLRGPRLIRRNARRHAYERAGVIAW